MKISKDSIHSSFNIYDNMPKLNTILSKKKYLALKNDDKYFIDKKLKEIEELYLEIKNKLK